MSSQKEQFAYSITPRDNLFDLRLRDIWNFRDLLMLFVHRDFVAVYKQTILGPLWFFVQPLLTTLGFTVIFGKVAKIPTDGLPPIIFYLAGVTAWNYFAECFRKTANSFTQNAHIFGKVYFPRLVVPISVVISSLVQLLVQFGLLIVIMVVYTFYGFDLLPPRRPPYQSGYSKHGKFSGSEKSVFGPRIRRICCNYTKLL